MAAPVGLEPTTSRLTAACSAIELWGNTSSLEQGWEWQGSNPRLQGFNLVLQPSQLHSHEAEDRGIVRVASPSEKPLVKDYPGLPCGKQATRPVASHLAVSSMRGKNGGTRTLSLQIRNLRCNPVTPRSDKAESSGLVREPSPSEKPQLFIHLFSKQRQSPDRFTLHC